MDPSRRDIPPLATQPETTDGSDAPMKEKDSESLSPGTKNKLNLLLKRLRCKEATLQMDEAGNPFVDYSKPSYVRDVYGFEPNVISTTEEDVKTKMEACLELICFFQQNKAPSGVVLDNEKIHLESGKYREGKTKEFTNLSDSLNFGTMAGNIVTVQDNKSGTEHVQKTVMITDFREEEVRAWVDLDGEGMCPSLYCFYIKDGEIVFHMEKLEEAITLRDVIDIHMKNLKKRDPEMVDPLALYIFHGLLSAVNYMHDKNWTHQDLHASNVMVQKREYVLHVKVLDFGLASKLREEGVYNVLGEQGDIYQSIRLFTALSLGRGFESALDLQKTYEQFKQTIQMSSEVDKTEVFQLVDAAMTVASSGEGLEETIKEVEDKLTKIEQTQQNVCLSCFDLISHCCQQWPADVSNCYEGVDLDVDFDVDLDVDLMSILMEEGALFLLDLDNMMKRVAAILFDEEDYLSIHKTSQPDTGDAVRVSDNSPDVQDKAAGVPDEFIQSRQIHIRSGSAVKVDGGQNINQAIRHDDTAVLMVTGAGDGFEVFRKDVHSMEALLIGNCGIIEDKIYPVIYKPKSKVSAKKRIKEAIANVAAELEGIETGHFIFFYSGHFGNHSLEIDSKDDSAVNIYADEELVDDLLQIPAKYVLFIMDMDIFSSARQITDEQNDFEMPRLWDLFTSKRSSKGEYEDGKVLLWASSLEDQSYGRDYSYFTKAIIDVIIHPEKGQAIRCEFPDDTYVTVLQLNAHVTKLMAEHGVQQIPMIKPETADTSYFQSFPPFAKIR